MFMNWNTLNVIKIALLHKIACRFSAFSFKTFTAFFAEIEKLILKFI